MTDPKSMAVEDVARWLNFIECEANHIEGMALRPEHSLLPSEKAVARAVISLVERAVAREREAAAKVCEERSGNHAAKGGSINALLEARACAAAIRARGA